MAIVIAKKMKEKFGDKIELNIYLNDSVEAKGYTLLSSTNVFVNGQLVPRETALDKENMYDFLNEILN
ncbi:HSGNP motif-containing (seleno)protein [Desulfoscipio sp. XC116]|uniref:HSGNPxU motif (seleno)protein TsoX n=1 Tax=Desulfoscipio sp. XC116 TaxID=3144975 RepID=UPI00325B1081